MNIDIGISQVGIFQSMSALRTATFFEGDTGGTYANDPTNYTLGVNLRVMEDGQITKLRFFKPTQNVQTGRDWGIWLVDAPNTLLWSGTSVDEPDGGAWVEIKVEPPLDVDYGTELTIGCTTNEYSVTSAFFTQEIRRDPIHARVTAGRFNAGATLTRPTQAFNNANYYLDLELTYLPGSYYSPMGVPDPVTIPVGYPNASNTGVSGVLTPDSWVRSASNGQVIENKEIFGNIFVDHDDVIIRNCRITAYGVFHAIQQDINAGSTNLTVEDCEINGRNTTVNGILGIGTFERNNIYGVHNGINTGNGVITDNYIHALGGFAGDDPHYDGIECNGGTIVVTHNTILNAYNQTAAVQMNNQFSALENCVIDDNILAGGAYTVYVDNNKSAEPVTNISITDNKLKSGQFGYYALYTSGVEPTGNIDIITNEQIDVPSNALSFNGQPLTFNGEYLTLGS